MSSLGRSLASNILRHSDAEKAFRPLWDYLKDFLVYSLVMLGVIVAPTAIIDCTPLECNLCHQPSCNGTVKDDLTHVDRQQRDPKFNKEWVKKVCTATDLDGFISYFPFILLVMPLFIVLIEQLFFRLFKAGLQLDTFYDLLAKASLENGSLVTSSLAADSSRLATPMKVPPPPPSPLRPTSVFRQTPQPRIRITATDMENTSLAIRVSQSFYNSTGFFWSYFARTLSEAIVSGVLLGWLSSVGISSINSQKSNIPCNVHGFMFECAGHPQNFYRIILFIAMAIIGAYLICCIYSLHWLFNPNMSSLHRVMKRYQRGATRNQQLGNLNDVYFNNRDLKLLLNLLSTSSGIAPSLHILTLFDGNFRAEMEPSNLEVSFSPNENDPVTQVDVKVTFGDPEAIQSHFSLMPNIQTIYSVELIPPQPGGSSPVQILTRSATASRVANGHATKEEIEVANLMGSPVVFEGLNANQEYMVRVSTIINGRAIARKIRLGR